MARITLRQLLDHAAEYSYGFPAFNINNMEQVLAIMEAASEVDAPVILQASRGARSYAGVKDYCETYWEPDYTPSATDLLACSKITPQAGIPGKNSPLESPNSQTGAN